MLFCSLEVMVYSIDFSAFTFNVQNLFDGIDDRQEYKEYKPPKWTEDDYQKRLVAIGRALQSVNPMPSIIALQEVENSNVVEELQKYYLPQLPYVVVSDNPYSATENALLSKYKILRVHTHRVGGKAGKRNRYLLDVRLEIPPSSKNDIAHILQVLVVHLKSKRTQTNSTGKTIISSDAIRHMQYQLIITVIDKSIPTIVLGDFNDGHPLDSLPNNMFTTFTLKSQHDSVSGSYYYKKEWEQIDHILLDTLANDFFSNEVITVWDKTPFINSKNIPNQFFLYFKNFNAVSDHLPVLFNAEY